MNSAEFCEDCKHHYTFHEDGKERCMVLYPPRYVDLDKDVTEMAKIDRVYYAVDNFCMCKKFV